MEPRTLSSAQTFIAKFVFPVVWISMFGIGTLSMWLGASRSAGGGTSSDDPRLGFLVAWVLGTLFILATCAGLKRVRVDANYIYVSNYVREVQVPIGNIREVTENRLSNIHPIAVSFRDSTEFGIRIKFMPKARWCGLWSAHPVVAELKELASAGRFRETGSLDA
jgi:hypothetical protein